MVIRFVYLLPEVLGLEPSTLCMRSMYPTAELYPYPLGCLTLHAYVVILNGPLEMLHRTNSPVFTSLPDNIHILHTLCLGLLVKKEGLSRKGTPGGPVFPFPVMSPSSACISGWLTQGSNTSKKGEIGPWLFMFLRMLLSQGLPLGLGVLAQAEPLGPEGGPAAQQSRGGWQQAGHR